ncbi:MAG: hypothetical protein IJR95_04595 [Lachnospiraceae bacterium]|nr:hypothetical protein [Lachnospiraceae bacterium]
MGCKSAEKMAAWTTPSIRYKPSQVEMSEVEEIIVIVSQMGKRVLELNKEGAAVSEDGFVWPLSQEETGLLSGTVVATIQVDYKTTSGLRYTTMPKSFDVVSSAVQGVI